MKKEKTSNIAMRYNTVLAIKGSIIGFNERIYVITDGAIYKDTWYKDNLARRIFIGQKDILGYVILVL